MKKIGSDPEKTNSALSVFMTTISFLNGCAFLFSHRWALGALWIIAGCFFLLGYLRRRKK